MRSANFEFTLGDNRMQFGRVKKSFFVMVLVANANFLWAQDQTQTVAITPSVESTNSTISSAELGGADNPEMLETVVVSGLQSGPDLWKVIKGDNVLWILGTQAPLPKRMEWEPYRVERLISQSQEVILAPSASLDIEGNFFGNLFLIPSALKARNNPEKKQLRDVLEPEVYARWQKLKAMYLGRDKDLEYRRPFAVAAELFEAAVEKSDLSFKAQISKVVEKAAKKNDVLITRPNVELKISEPKKLLKEFNQSTLDDQACLDKTMRRIETDLPDMSARANAWATGDIQALRDLPFDDQRGACDDAFLSSSVVQKRGFGDLVTRINNTWLSAAENALNKNTKSLALLPMRQLLASDGLLAMLQAKGYQVVAPDVVPSN